jgi:hypothetical protein
MARGKRAKKRRMEPALPEERRELTTPRYFNVFSGAGAREKESKELIPKPMPKLKTFPRVLPSVKPGRRARGRIQKPPPKPEKVPLLIRVGRYIRSGLIEPRKPEAMPKIPELNFPRLYRRLPTMKTVTKVTDVNGKITVDFPHPFEKEPEILMTIKGEDTLFGNITETTKESFTAIFFTVEHDHGSAVTDGGSHRPVINADGGHMHDVYGELFYTKYWTYGWLAPYFFTTDESNPGDPHHHNISNAAANDHYMTDLDITSIYLWTSYEEDPRHYHTARRVEDHDHEIIPDGSTLWTEKAVTITYMAQTDVEE